MHDQLDQASKGITKQEDAISRRQAKLKAILEGDPNRKILSFGPRDDIELSETAPPPGTFQDPAVIFARMKQQREEQGV